MVGNLMFFIDCWVRLDESHCRHVSNTVSEDSDSYRLNANSVQVLALTKILVYGAKRKPIFLWKLELGYNYIDHSMENST